MDEVSKYIEIYSGNVGKNYEARHSEGYGRGFWGKNAIPYLKEQNPKSVCDVGCGYGRFCNAITEFTEKVYGLDIASVKTNNVIQNPKVVYIDSEAKQIPLPDKCVEWVTSFDCLEHCLPQDIDSILDEFDRISTKGFILSISYTHDSHGPIVFHMTVQPENWWLQKLEKYGKIERGEFILESQTRYIIVKK